LIFTEKNLPPDKTISLFICIQTSFAYTVNVEQAKLNSVQYSI